MADKRHQYAELNPQGNGPTPRQFVDDRTETLKIPVDASNLNAGDELKFAFLNERTIVRNVSLTATELDTGGGLTLDVGYETEGGTVDADYFFAAETVGQAGGTVHSASEPFSPGEKFFLTATVNGAATTPAEGQVWLTLEIGLIG